MKYHTKAVRYYFISFVFFIVVLFYSSLAFGATYYVDNSGDPICDNKVEFGGESKPWCTISYAISNLKGGDEVYVKSGTYNETLYISNISGTAEKRTEIKVYQGHKVVIKGKGVDTGRIKIAGSKYVVFDGFEVTNMNQGIFVENNSNNIIIQNCKVHFVGQEAIHIKDNSDNVIIQKCSVYDTNKWQYNGEGIYIGTGSSGEKDNTSHVTVRNNLIYNTIDEAVELKAGTHDCTIEGNIIFNISTAPKVGAIEINPALLGNQYWDSNPNHIIKNNIIHDTDTAIHAGTGCIIYNNVIYNVKSESYGIYVSNRAGDAYVREIYHNTIDVLSSNAIKIAAGSTEIKNNIGPVVENNLASNATYFVTTQEGSEDYHLKDGASPINIGIDLSLKVPFDIEGNKRIAGTAADLGAYEYTYNMPSPPRNLRIVQ